MKKLVSSTIMTVCMVSVIAITGCRSVSPKLQDECIRPGLSQGMYGVFDKYRELYPEMMVERKVPGLSIALVDREGILWSAGFGYTDYGRKTPVTIDTLFNICSMSKTITATALMLAVQDGLLELDIPIIEYWPQFTVNSRFEENPEKKITLRHLMDHTSGLGDDFPVGNVRDAGQPSYGSCEEGVLSVSDTWLRHKVGERYSYSIGPCLAAYVLQVQSGQLFAKYLEDRVFTPLNMPNCSADIEFIRNHPNRAVGHFSEPYIVRQFPAPSEGCGSGGIYASAREMASFVQFHLNQGKVDGQTVLDENLITRIGTPSIRQEYYGLGIQIYQTKGDDYILGHGGGGLGFATEMMWLPEYGFGAVFLSNGEGANRMTGRIISDLAREILIQKDESVDRPPGEYLAPPPLPDPNTFTPFKPAWKKYIGTYKYVMSGWKFSIPARIVLGLGITTGYTHVKVYEKDGYLCVNGYHQYLSDDGGQLDEHLPGLFFTPSGLCLDLRGPELRWTNYRIKKTNNDNDGNFDIDL